MGMHEHQGPRCSEGGGRVTRLVDCMGDWLPFTSNPTDEYFNKATIDYEVCLSVAVASHCLL